MFLLLLGCCQVDAVGGLGARSADVEAAMLRAVGALGLRGADMSERHGVEFSLTSASFQDDPWSMFEALRDACPVHHTDDAGAALHRLSRGRCPGGAA